MLGKIADYARGWSAPHGLAVERFDGGGRARQDPGRIVLRSLRGSALIVLCKRLELARNRPVGHGLGATKQGLGGFQIFPASSRNLQRHETLARLFGSGLK